MRPAGREGVRSALYRDLWAVFKRFRHLSLECYDNRHRQGIESPVTNLVPDSAESDDPKPQDGASSFEFPFHSREFEPLGEDDLAGGFCDTAANGEAKMTVGPVVHP